MSAAQTLAETWVPSVLLLCHPRGRGAFTCRSAVRLPSPAFRNGRRGLRASRFLKITGPEKLYISLPLPCYWPLYLPGKFGNVVSKYAVPKLRVEESLSKKKDSQFRFCQCICSIKDKISHVRSRIFCLVESSGAGSVA